MEKGQIVEITIEDMSGEGQGIGRTDGFVLFVSGAVVGDVVKARLTKVKKNYGLAETLEIVEPSPDREYGFDCGALKQGCGGCGYGCIKYEAQLDLKWRQVYEKLQRIAGIQEPAVMPIMGMEDDDNGGRGPFRYRNKAQFQVGERGSAGAAVDEPFDSVVGSAGAAARKGGTAVGLKNPAVGFCRAGSHEVVDCRDCFLQSEAAVAAARALRTFMAEYDITAWDPKKGRGVIRHMIVKTAFATGEVMAVLAINGGGISNMRKLIEMLDDAVYDAGYSLESVVLKVREGAKAEDKIVVAAGSPVIHDRIGELEFEISADSFYQVNPTQMKRLYDKVREYCGFGAPVKRGAARGEDSGTEGKPVVLDIYCGVGSIGLYCADAAEAVIGIESVKAAVLDANRNAVINGIVNARYICGRAEEILPMYSGISDVMTDEASDVKKDVDPDVAAIVKRADIAILDPPRAGCRPELLNAVAGLGVERIVYVSCDPATLARDIKLLSGMGYRFKKATPCDMFPWSSHTECVAAMTRV